MIAIAKPAWCRTPCTFPNIFCNSATAYKCTSRITLVVKAWSPCSGERVSEFDEEEPEMGAEGFPTPGRQRLYHGTDTIVGRMSGHE